MSNMIKYVYKGEVVRTSDRIYTHAWTFDGKVKGCSSSHKGAVALARERARNCGSDADEYMKHVEIVELGRRAE